MNPCAYTHDQLISGKCPWCDCRFGDSTMRNWNLYRLETDLTASCREIVFGTLVNVRRFVPDALAFSVIDKALDLLDDDIEFVTTSIAVVKGIGASTTRLFEHGDIFLKDESQLASAFFFLGGSQILQFSSQEIRGVRAKVVSKLISLRPDMHILGRPESALPTLLYPVDVNIVQRIWESKRRSCADDERVVTNHLRWMQYSGYVERIA